ncbi:efflux RND transporter permease subunit [Candidatus Rariloculus sp.]|uniref:efflux RND transporter permease subunit n=1 Tax=Candidatus Rariloculus sp. TaxID=3101265 RepID=UPI003D0ECAEA
MASNGVAANLLMFAILGAGLVSLTGLEREAWPSVPFNHIEVSMAYPGATPEEVEESIVVKIEEQVSSLDDVLAVKSVAAPGMASVRIEVPLFRLRALGLTLDDIANAIRRGSLDLSAGSINTRESQVRVRTLGQRYDQHDFEEIVVLSSSDGTIVRLGDIAEVRDDFQDIDLIVRRQNQPAAFVEVFRVEGEQVMDVATAVQEHVAEVIIPSLPFPTASA